jgi:hypothetical protein
MNTTPPFTSTIQHLLLKWCPQEGERHKRSLSPNPVIQDLGFSHRAAQISRRKAAPTMPSTRKRSDATIACNDHSRSSVFTGSFATTTRSWNKMWDPPHLVGRPPPAKEEVTTSPSRPRMKARAPRAVGQAPEAYMTPRVDGKRQWQHRETANLPCSLSPDRDRTSHNTVARPRRLLHPQHFLRI